MLFTDQIFTYDGYCLIGKISELLPWQKANLVESFLIVTI